MGRVKEKTTFDIFINNYVFVLVLLYVKWNNSINPRQAKSVESVGEGDSQWKKLQISDIKLDISGLPGKEVIIEIYG